MPVFGLMRSSFIAVAAASSLSACGASEQAASGSDLASWRQEVCRLSASYERGLDAEPEQGNEPPAVPSAESTRREIEATRELAAALRAVPLPDDRRADAERFVELFAVMAKQYEASLPRIEAAARRWERVLATVDPESLPAPPKGETVAGGIMAQLMSVPAARDAWNDMMREYEAIAKASNPQEMDRLAKRLGLDQCLDGQTPERLSAEELARCGARGSPVTLATLVEVFRANGITLDIDEDTCKRSARERSAAALPGATNGGPTGVDAPDEVERREGYVLCDVESQGADPKVTVEKYDGDTETHLSALNVYCTIYPYDAASEARQVRQVKNALEALVAAVGAAAS